MCCDSLSCGRVFEDDGCLIPHGGPTGRSGLKCWKQKKRGQMLPSCCSSANSYHELSLNISAGSPGELRRPAVSSVPRCVFYQQSTFSHVIHGNRTVVHAAETLFDSGIHVTNVLSRWTFNNMSGMKESIFFLNKII